MGPVFCRLELLQPINTKSFCTKYYNGFTQHVTLRWALTNEVTCDTAVVQYCVITTTTYSHCIHVCINSFYINNISAIL